MGGPRALTTVMSARAHVSLLVVVVVWAGSFSVIKQLLDDGVAAGDIAILRYLIAAPGFAFILWRAGGLPGLTRRDAARVAAAGLFVVLGYHLFLNLGTRHTTSGVAALVVALAPGRFDVELLTFQGAGSAAFELYAARGAFVDDADTDAWRLVGDNQWVDAGRPGIDGAGWTVNASPPAIPGMPERPLP